MPRFGHWVIIAANAPTAFRAKHRETLVPTLKQLQRTQPDAVLKWFDGGRLWSSPAEANEAKRQRRQTPKRPQTWRPGGTHEDPRARFELSRDEKRARFKRRLGARRPGSSGPASPDATGAHPPGRKSGKGASPSGMRKGAGFGPRRRPGGPRGPKRGPK